MESFEMMISTINELNLVFTLSEVDKKRLRDKESSEVRLLVLHIAGFAKLKFLN